MIPFQIVNGKDGAMKSFNKEEIFKKETLNINGWNYLDNKIYKEFCFSTHLDAIKFLEGVSLEGISEDFYPIIRLSFQKVEISFDVKDDRIFFRAIDFLKKIERISNSFTG